MGGSALSVPSKDGVSNNSMSSTANSPMTAQEIRNHLDQYTCTEAYHRHQLVDPRLLVFTDGAVGAAELMKCWWLLDIIASYQYDRTLRALVDARHFVVWRITVVDGEGIVSAHEDWDNQHPEEFPPVIKQKIEYTDFPLPEFYLWQEGNVLLLPSEH